MPPPMQTRIKVVHPYYKVVKGVPAAIVRSYKEPLYDADFILSAAPGTERIFFQNPVGQALATGAVKTQLHTNQTTAGQLGTPISFDLYGYNLRLPKNIVLADYQAIQSAGVIQVVFGQDTIFLTVPMQDIPAGVDTEGMGATDAPHVGLGQSDNFYRFDINGQALHINSTEAFNTRMFFPSGIGTVTADTLAQFFMRGIKYKGV